MKTPLPTLAGLALVIAMPLLAPLLPLEVFHRPHVFSPVKRCSGWSLPR